MTQLEEGKSITRIVRIHGIGSVAITMSAEGISMRIPGTKSYVTAMWGEVIKLMHVPATAKSYLVNDPFRFLQTQAQKAEKTQARRANKKAQKEVC